MGNRNKGDSPLGDRSEASECDSGGQEGAICAAEVQRQS